MPGDHRHVGDAGVHQFLLVILVASLSVKLQDQAPANANRRGLDRPIMTMRPQHAWEYSGLLRRLQRTRIACVV
jgi:hypothetical protein